MGGLIALIGRRAVPQEYAISPRHLVLSHRGPESARWLRIDGGSVSSGHGALPVAAGDAAAVQWRLSVEWTARDELLPSADGRFALLLDGQIHNRDALRGTLASPLRGRSSDAALLTALIAERGPAVLDEVEGMFALVLFDLAARSVTLARDRYGMKPLYFTRASGALVVASEIKALLPELTGRPTLNAKRTFEFLRYGIGDYGAETLFREVQQIPPGCAAKVTLEEPRDVCPEPYHQDVRPSVVGEDAGAKLRELILESTALQMPASEVGVSLSGGLDSTTLAAAARASAPNTTIHAFTYVSDAPQLSELRWASEAARSLGLVLHEVQFTHDQLRADLDRLIQVHDEPFGGSSVYAQYRVYRAAAEAGVAVMLDGQGADIVFGGAGAFLAREFRTAVLRLRLGRACALFDALRRQSPVPNRRRTALVAASVMVPERFDPALRRLARRTSRPPLAGAWFATHDVRPAAISPAYVSRSVPRARLGALERDIIPASLRHQDRDSMAHSVESRAPFLLPRLADWAMSLPVSELISRSGLSKYVLRRAAEPLVPAAVLARRDKIGFEPSQHAAVQALSAGLRTDVSLLHDRYGDDFPIDLGRYSGSVDTVLAGEGSFDQLDWRILTFLRWLTLYEVDPT